MNRNTCTSNGFVIELNEP